MNEVHVPVQYMTLIPVHCLFADGSLTGTAAGAVVVPTMGTLPDTCTAATDFSVNAAVPSSICTGVDFVR